MKKILPFLALFCGLSLLAQEQSALKYQAAKRYAVFVKEVHISPSKSVKNATILFEDNTIVGIKEGKERPQGYIFVDRGEAYAYPGFIDMYSDYGVKVEKLKKKEYGAQHTSLEQEEFYWNDAIRTHMEAAQMFEADEKEAEKMRKAGFVAVNTHHADGFSRGQSAIVDLGGEKPMVQEKALAIYSIDKGSSGMDYPSSLMGVFALYRDYFNDVEWYKSNKLNNNLTLNAAIRSQGAPALILAESAQDILRTEKLFKDKYSKRAVFSDGDAYKVVDFLPKDAVQLSSLNFPSPVALQSAYDASLLNLEDMKHWEFAPANAKLLRDNGIKVAFTHMGVKKADDFLKNLNKAVAYGLSEADALAALTTVPAEFLGLKNYGTLDKGNMAFFFLTDKPLFDGGSVIENWIGEDQKSFGAFALPELVGNYQLNVPEMGIYAFEIEYKKGAYKISPDTLKNKDLKAEVELSENSLTITLNPKTESAVVISTHRVSENNFEGKAYINGGLKTAQLTLLNKTPIVNDDKKETTTNLPINKLLPLKAYGSSALPKAKTYVFKNATVWTNTNQGIVENTDVYVSNGKILAVGKNLAYAGAEVVDATGMHLTSGIIDEHSHIGISKGVNEGGQAVSAEVTIEDVVNPWDVNIYRQLAGGVTAAQLLHGSANPIGGRSALVKLKYGFTPEDMLIDGADGFIKFALGENVKQSNWGDFNTTRFPQTRMGVEQLMTDAFERALAYKQAKADWAKMNPIQRQGKLSPRPNTELDVVLEVLEGKRFVTCHSYVQSEINMLMKLAERYGFRINTFTHILEGYKVADKMREHGVGASTFSDWWAYKFEVKDAIPYNAAILHENGVLTAINSDDAEMGRRLNQEAAKVVKYGGISPEEAWKMVTLNPAKLLHLDNRMGSVEVGKDADLVLWSASPLSIAAQAQKTIIDGILMFDREDSEVKELAANNEKTRIYKLMLKAIANGEKPQSATGKSQTVYHCMGEFH